MVDAKRDRYPPREGLDLVPMVFETGGRPSDEAVSFVRSYGANLDDAGLESMMLTTLFEMDGNRYEEMFRRMNPPGCGTMYFTTGLALSSSIGFLRGGIQIRS